MKLLPRCAYLVPPSSWFTPLSACLFRFACLLPPKQCQTRRSLPKHRHGRFHIGCISQKYASIPASGSRVFCATWNREADQSRFTTVATPSVLDSLATQLICQICLIFVGIILGHAFWALMLQARGLLSSLAKAGKGSHVRGHESLMAVFKVKALHLWLMSRDILMPNTMPDSII